jgi:hypothetical protein
MLCTLSVQFIFSKWTHAKHLVIPVADRLVLVYITSQCTLVYSLGWRQWHECVLTLAPLCRECSSPVVQSAISKYWCTRREECSVLVLNIWLTMHSLSIIKHFIQHSLGWVEQTLSQSPFQSCRKYITQWMKENDVFRQNTSAFTPNVITIDEIWCKEYSMRI